MHVTMVHKILRQWICEGVGQPVVYSEYPSNWYTGYEGVGQPGVSK